jgi:hypothetical protein
LIVTDCLAISTSTSNVSPSLDCNFILCPAIDIEVKYSHECLYDDLEGKENVFLFLRKLHRIYKPRQRMSHDQRKEKLLPYKVGYFNIW